MNRRVGEPSTSLFRAAGVSWRFGGWMVLAVFLGGCGPRGPLQVPLRYEPTTRLAHAPLGVQLEVGVVEDARPGNKNEIGRNVEEDEPVQVLSTSEEVVATVRSGLSETLRAAGFDRQGGTKVVLDVQILNLWVQEDNVYKASVSLKFTMRSGAQARGEVVVEGTDTRWGSSLEAEEYRNVLSDALVESVEKLVDSPEFSAATRGI